jgi:hypothetical protein
MLGIGVFAALTMTPTRASLDGPSGSTSVSLAVNLPSAAQLLSVSSESLNIVAGAFLGFCATAGFLTRKMAVSVGISLCLPVVSELVQWSIPQLGRVGFSLTDVVLNWSGVLLGFITAYVLLLVYWCARRRRKPVSSRLT